MKSLIRVGLFALALGGSASADRVDPWLGTWTNPAPAQGDVTKVEIAEPAYVSAKAHAWTGSTDLGVNGAVMMGEALMANYETATHYIDLTLQPPSGDEMVYDMKLRLKSTMLTAGVLHGTLKRQ